MKPRVPNCLQFWKQEPFRRTIVMIVVLVRWGNGLSRFGYFNSDLQFAPRLFPAISQ